MTDKYGIQFSSAYKLGDHVLIDGDQAIKATVTAHCFRENYSTVEVSWFSNGSLHTQWLETWRLRPA